MGSIYLNVLEDSSYVVIAESPVPYLNITFGLSLSALSLRTFCLSALSEQ
jgi:hypothetical protein